MQRYRVDNEVGSYSQDASRDAMCGNVVNCRTDDPSWMDTKGYHGKIQSSKIDVGKNWRVIQDGSEKFRERFLMNAPELDK